MLDASIAPAIIPAFPFPEVMPELRLILKGALTGGILLDLQCLPLPSLQTRCFKEDRC